MSQFINARYHWMLTGKFVQAGKLLSCLGVLAFTAQAASAAKAPKPTLVKVKPKKLNGWEIGLASTGTGTFVEGPGQAPAGCGTFRMTTGAGDATNSLGGLAYVFNRDLAGTKLSDVTTLRYWTYNAPTSTAASHLAAALRIPIDYVGDGSSYAEIIFEPIYFNRVFGYQPVVLGEWQGWDALMGRWWSSVPIPGVPLGRDSFVPWSAILAANPNAKILDGLGLYGGQTSYGRPWDGYDGNIDAMQMGASGVEKIFDFEAPRPDAECKVRDNVKPTITAPVDKTIVCTDSTLPSNTGIATAIDNEDADPAIGYTDVFTGDPPPGAATIVRTWRATDATGNFATANQTITLTATNLPLIFSFTPASGPSGTTVVITGGNFLGTTAVKIGNRVVSSFTVDSNSQITATVPENAVTGRITVTQSFGTATSATNFTVTSPTITSFTPASGVVGTIVTINGANLGAASGVTFSGVSAGAAVADITLSSDGFQIVSATQVKARVPAGAVTGIIRISDASGAGVSISNFAVLPTLSGFSPVNGVATVTGVPGSIVTISGVTFTGTTAVKFNNLTAGAAVADIAAETAGFQIVSDTELRARVPLNATSGKISVTNAGGTATSVDSFTVAPRVNSFTAASGPSGTIVTINGANFTGATDVTFNGVSAGSAVADITVAASGFQIVSATQIKAKVPASTSTGKIGVTNGFGDTGLSATNFTVNYRISGRIVDSNGNPLAGATVKRSGTTTGVTTNANGEYLFSALAAGTYTITPTRVGYTMAPTALTVVITNNDGAAQDFIANLN